MVQMHREASQLEAHITRHKYLYIKNPEPYAVTREKRAYLILKLYSPCPYFLYLS